MNKDLIDILLEIEELGSEEGKQSKLRFGIYSAHAKGVSLKVLKELAKKYKKNADLAIGLFNSHVYEAKLLTALLFPLKSLTEEHMEKWCRGFDTWEICDCFCMTLFSKSPFVLQKIADWVKEEEEFQKRAAFACMASYAYAQKSALNEEFQNFFPLMIEHAKDERKYVMKAINWALRQIGKRNRDLKESALQTAEIILRQGSKSAKWIARDAIRELQKPDVCLRNYPRVIYEIS